jgi:thiamine-phosphate pyrophosphorylase
MIADDLRDSVAALFVNDRADIARIVAADGLHLPETGFSVDAARSVVGDTMLIGRSTHSTTGTDEALDAGVDYTFLGPVWTTSSHPDTPPIGLEPFQRVPPGRVVAIGGVTPDRVAEAVAAGAWGVAAIDALWKADDPRAAAEAMLISLEP